MASTLTVQELKRALVSAGFEVYRTQGAEVHLAERPRENLIMDAGVSVVIDGLLRVRMVTRAQKNDFPGEDGDRLTDRARRQGDAALARGFAERSVRERTLYDPGDGTKVLDTWLEVFFEKDVAALPEVLDEVRFAMGVEKTAPRGA
ncbi:MAG TPA: hypothetical protein VFS43_26195 [Polyangiaceae bacterium]|nr:hypothetical protein [Polyangiaceae bacterium]